MYKEYYGFSHIPFDKEISTSQILLHNNFREFKSRMTFLKKHGGIAVLWGTSGSGKSVGLRWLRDSLNKNRFHFYYISHPPNSSSEFFRQLADSMGLIPVFRQSQLFNQIQNYILELSQEKKIIPIIALDEAQLFSHSVLESIRLFLNFDIDSKQNVILILSGQPELKRRLKFAVYEPLIQRVTVHHHFAGVTHDEVEKYIAHRLDIAGVKHQLFEPDAIQFIFQITKGILRKIDQIALTSLAFAASQKKKSIDTSIVQQSLKEVFWV